MGHEQGLLPPPTGSPVATQLLLPARPPSLPVAHDSAPASRPPVPQRAPLRKQRPFRRHLFKRFASWVIVLGAIVGGFLGYRHLRDNWALRTPVITPQPDGVKVDVGSVSFRMPSAPTTVRIHLSGTSSHNSGYVLATPEGTVQVGVVNTDSVHSAEQLQQFCAENMDAITAREGSRPLRDQTSTALGVYRRTTSWQHDGQFVLATCITHRKTSVVLLGNSPRATFRAYQQVADSLTFDI